MQIQVLSNFVETKMNTKNKPMQILEVAYKNLTFQGKVESKKLFDFGAQKDVFPVLAAASPGSVWEVEVVKNAQGYNDWVKVTKSDGAAGAEVGVSSGASGTTRSASSNSGGTSTNAKGSWETPEERAKKQIYIVRQSSLSAAIATLTCGRKTEIKPEEVIGLASQYEAFVFSVDSVEGTVAQDVGGLDTMSEDIPF